MAHVGRAGVTALAALLVVDVALVALAFRHVQGSAEADPVGVPTVEETRRPEKQQEKQPAEPSKLDPAKKVVVDIGADEAVARGLVGGCGQGGATVELSLDGGETWQASELPDAQVLLRIAMADADSTEVIAMDQDCQTATLYETSDGGGTWEEVDGADGEWHRLSGETAKVNTPYGRSQVSCAASENVVALSTLGTNEAFALCSDGALLATTDAGQSWEPQGQIADATDLDFVDTNVGLAVLPNGESCTGIGVQKTEDGGESWEPAGCIEADVSSIPNISSSGDRAYIAMGNQLWYSEDGGSTWEQRAS